MPRFRPALWFTLLAACLLLAAAPALAVPITYQVVSGIGFSQLDPADKSGYIGDVYGDLTMDHDASTDTFSFVSSTVWLDSTEYLFTITGGFMHADGGGTLDFDLIGVGEYAQTASFYFQGGAPVCCGPNGPNFATTNQIKLFGSSVPGPSGFIPVNINMTANVGGAPAMPEPSAALVFGIGALFVRTAIRRRATR